MWRPWPAWRDTAGALDMGRACPCTRRSHFPCTSRAPLGGVAVVAPGVPPLLVSACLPFGFDVAVREGGARPARPPRRCMSQCLPAGLQVVRTRAGHPGVGAPTPFRWRALAGAGRLFVSGVPLAGFGQARWLSLCRVPRWCALWASSLDHWREHGAAAAALCGDGGVRLPDAVNGEAPSLRGWTRADFVVRPTKAQCL